uniref:Host ubiquitin fusion degradation n=1 Tax=Nitzschia sp. IriIs04 TaxID=1444690 RepID=A0A0P0YV96_9STRA|nr:host ubiquitin fusion degradation [Nitzschia sp. IriIs04]
MMHGWGFAGGGFGGGFGNARFEEQYHCYSVAYADKSHLEKGDKILLPPSAFDTLARLQVDYPMLFRLTSGTDNRFTHCGVLEFTAEEGTCYIPFWMMQNLLIEEGSVITVTNVSLPKASFVKLQPQSVDFLEISNPRAVLEHALRNFSCVTKGDVIQIPYNNKNYHFALKEVQPQDAACIIETDCNVDFDAPVGYKEPEPVPVAPAVATAVPGMANTGSTATTTSGSKPTEEEEDKNRLRIVNGQIVRPEDTPTGPTSEMLAERIGATGVQKNAAIAQEAPEIDYWAVNAGDGARLDGKVPAVLKDKDGQEVDIRKLRAEAAAKRAEAAAAAQAKIAGSGKTLTGEAAPEPEKSSSPAAKVSKRKTKVGGKFSRLKQGNMAFKGSANNL